MGDKELVPIKFQLNKDSMPEVEQMMKQMGLKTQSELFNYALSLLLWAIEAKNRGRIIASVDEASGRYQEIVIPFGPNLSP